MQKPSEKVEHLLRELRGLTLSDGVRTRMRVELSSYADLHTAHAAVPAKQSPFTWLSMTAWYRASATLMAVLLLAGGTAYASEDSLPGSPLYTVKVKIKEPIEVALATTPQKKAEKHTELAEERLEEAAKLAVAESLDADTQVYLEQQFSEHVDNTLAAATNLEANGEARESLAVRSNLESSLVAHADILDLVEDRLEETGEEDRPAHASTRNLLKAVELRHEVVRETRIALERNLEGSVTATETLALVTETEGSVRTEAKVAHLSRVAEHVAETDSALAEAKQSLESEDGVGRAFRKANEAERSSEVVNTLMENAAILLQVDTEVAATTTATTTPATATTTEEVLPPEPEENRSWWR